MRALVVERFGEPPVLREVPDPEPGARDALVRVEATGACRSDWHAWAGHDDTVHVPYIPGHEFVGLVERVGADVRGVTVGQRVTSPFVCGCGECDDCRAGAAQVCENQQQPGFTYDGSYAEFVVIRNADTNAVVVPDDVDAQGAALLGCRFATSFRGIVDRARVQPGEIVAVLGCGGVGLSAVMIAAAVGARVIGVDVDDSALERARAAGAETVVNVAGLSDDDALAVVRSAAGAAPDVAVEASGREQTLALGIRALRTHGRLVQIGLLPADPVVPMGYVTARELTLLGSHGMAAVDYPRMIDLMRSGALHPESLISTRIGLDSAGDALASFGAAPGSRPSGVTMIEL